MKKFILFFAITLVATGCTTTGIRNMSYEEAAAFENSLLARDRQTIEKPEEIFTQPVNKTEPCKLPTTQDQLDRRNFRAYWDGDCKNGFAYGLGRYIATSDTHHFEEITIRDGAEKFNINRPYVRYDFVNNTNSYGMRGESYPAESGRFRVINNTQESFGIRDVLGLVDESGNSLVLVTSPFNPVRYYSNQHGDVEYRLTDFTGMPGASNSVSIVIEIFDRKAKVAGGVRILHFKNGTREYQKLDSGGQIVEYLVAIPEEYINHLLSKILEIEEAITIANISVQKAQQMEREYLYMACNGKHSIKGLDHETATKICTWRDKFNDSYAAASANYQIRLENMKQQAAIDELQLQIQQQIRFQQERDRAEANAKALKDLGQSFKEAGESIRNGMPTTTHTKCRNTLSGVDCKSTSF